MLRAPRSLNTHATLPPAGAAVSSVGNGELITCSSVSRCWARALAHKVAIAIKIKALKERTGLGMAGCLLAIGNLKKFDERDKGRHHMSQLWESQGGLID